MNIYSQICFDQRKLVTVPGPTTEARANSRLAATAIKNMESLGFTIDKTGYEALKQTSEEKLTAWYYETIDVLKKATGGDKNFEPFYPDFPDRYMDDTNFERFLEQIAHYWTGYRPDGTDPKEGVKSLEDHPLKMLQTIREEEAKERAEDIFENLLTSKMNLPTHEYMNVILPIIENDKNWPTLVSKTANRRTLCIMYAHALQQKADISKFPTLVTNDVMRVAKVIPYVKEKDVGGLFFGTQWDKLIIGHLKGNECRQLMKILANVNPNLSDKARKTRFIEDFARDKEAWKILFKMAHIGDKSIYASPKYNALREAVSDLRNNKLETWYGKVEKAFNKGDIKEIIDTCAERPGEYIKKMNRIIGCMEKNLPTENMRDTVAHFVNKSKECFDKCDPADLFGLYEYLNSRQRPERVAIHNVKGQLYNSGKEYERIDPKFALAIQKTIRKSVKDQISVQINGKPAWEGQKIYIQPELANMTIPGKDRVESSASLNQYTKGSKLDMERNKDGSPKNTRLFIWWTNQDKGYDNGRVDIDLSVDAWKEDLSELITLSYYDSGNKLGCRHSGDITDGGPKAGKGVCEYIDLDMKQLKDNGYRYVRCHVNSFTGQPFNELNCKFGWMERSELNKSQQFDIKAVKQKSELSSNSLGVNTVILDTYKGQILWLDSPDFNIKTANNIGSRSTQEMMGYLLDKYGQGDRMDMKTLAEIAVEANGGELTEDRQAADVLFTVEPIKLLENQINITAKDNDIWIGQFMTRQDGPDRNHAQTKDRKESIEEAITQAFERAENMDLVDKINAGQALDNWEEDMAEDYWDQDFDGVGREDDSIHTTEPDAGQSDVEPERDDDDYEERTR